MMISPFTIALKTWWPTDMKLYLLWCLFFLWVVPVNPMGLLVVKFYFHGREGGKICASFWAANSHLRDNWSLRSPAKYQVSSKSQGYYCSGRFESWVLAPESPSQMGFPSLVVPLLGSVTEARQEAESPSPVMGTAQLSGCYTSLFQPPLRSGIFCYLIFLEVSPRLKAKRSGSPPGCEVSPCTHLK